MVARIGERDDLAGLGHIGKRGRDLLGKHAVADLNRLKHGSRGNLKRLHNPGAQRQDGQEHDRKGNHELHDTGEPALLAALLAARLHRRVDGLGRGLFLV